MQLLDLLQVYFKIAPTWWLNKRNRNETWGRPSELSGVRQAARCLYDAGEPSWA